MFMFQISDVCSTPTITASEDRVPVPGAGCGLSLPSYHVATALKPETLPRRPSGCRRFPVVHWPQSWALTFLKGV